MSKYTRITDIFEGLAVVRMEHVYDKTQLKSLKNVDYIILHHTGGIDEIDAIFDLHKERNGWASIGYHFVIDYDGRIFYTRPITWQGAHTYGFNDKSIGIALTGNLDEKSVTQEQVMQLFLLLEILRQQYGDVQVLGHIEAIYKYLEEESGLELPRMPLKHMSDKEHVENFKKRLIYFFEQFAPEHVEHAQRFKSCPGVNFYPLLEHCRNVDGEE